MFHTPLTQPPMLAVAGVPLLLRVRPTVPLTRLSAM